MSRLHGGGFFKFMRREHTRDYPYRGSVRQEGIHADKSQLPRFLRTYVWPYRWLLVLTVLAMGLNSTYSYFLAGLNRIVVDEILVVTDVDGNPMTQPERASGVRTSHPVGERVVARTPPEESAGRKMARGIRLTRRPVEAGKALFMLGVLYVLVQCTFNLIGRRAAVLSVTLSTKIHGRLREDMHRKALELSLSYQQRISAGRLLSRIVSDTSAARNEFTMLIELLVGLVGMGAAGVLLLAISDWRVLLFFLCVLPLFPLIKNRYITGIRSLQKEQRHTNGSLYGLISQKMDAVKAIQSYGQQDAEVLAFRRLSTVYNRDAIRVQWQYRFMTFLIWLTLHLSTCVVFLVGGYFVATGRMSLGKLVFLQTLMQLLLQPVTNYSEVTFTLQRLRVALARCFGILDEPLEITEPPDAVDFPKPLKKGIDIEGLSFRYESAEKDALSDVTLRVPPGEWLCIMGASGSGKTTLLHLLARLYTPTTGEIRYDGTPLEKIRFGSLRTSLGVVPQEAQIFAGTVRDNIAYGLPEATNRQIIDAASAAQLHDFIVKEMPVQYETLIGEKGQSLSGGQRQRLSLARALLCNPEVLLLDDCTSALDANTERRIQETLMTQLAGKTAVIVSQRVSMAARCTHIAVLEHGRVAEYGTHRELLEANGFYATLFREQTK